MERYAASAMRVLLVLVLLLCSGLAHAEEDILSRFQRLGQADGLRTSWAMSLVRDRDGFIWVGSQGDGVFRYDGERFQQLPEDREPRGRVIRSMTLDRDGVLWVGAFDGGLSRFDAREDRFIVVDGAPGQIPVFSSARVWSLLADFDGALWVGTFDAGLNRYQPQSGQVETFRHDADDPRSLPGDTIQALHRDRQGRLWIGTRSGLAITDDPQRGFRRIELGTRLDKASYDEVFAFADAPEGGLLIATSAGLLRLASADAVPQVLDLGHTEPRDVLLRSLLVDSEGTIWTGSASVGLFRRPAGTETFWRLGHQRLRADSLAGRNVWGIIEDEWNRIWIAGRSGISIFDPSGNRNFVRVPVYLEELPGATEEPFLGLGFDRQGRLIYSDDLGVHRLSGNMREKQSWLLQDLLPPSLRDDRIVRLGTDSQGELWASTLSQHLVRLDLAEGRLVGEPVRIQRGYPRTIVPFSDHELLIAIWAGGIAIVDTLTGSVRQLTDVEVEGQAVSILPAMSASAALDDPRQAWVATLVGLFRVNVDSGVADKVTDVEGPLGRLSTRLATAAVYDRAGRLWIGTEGGGVSIGERRDGQWHFRPYPIEPDLDRRTVLSLLADPVTGFLWGTVESQVFGIDPQAGTVQVFGPSAGLPSDTFLSSESAVSHDGRVALAQLGAILSFRPTELRPARVRPPMVLQSVADGRGPILGGGTLRPSGEIRVPAPHQRLQFNFAVLDPTAGVRRFQYWLEGFDEDWLEGRGAPSVSYTNLPAGDYRLRYRALSADGEPGPEGPSLRVVLLAPWWKTPGAIATMLLLALVFGVYYLQRTRIALRRARETAEQLREADVLKSRFVEQLQSEVDARTRELRAQTEALLLKNVELQASREQALEAAQVKSRFLARMSHDLRTPLSGMLGFMELLADGPLDQRQTGHLAIVRESTEELLASINELLDFSRIEAGRLLLAQEPFDLDEMLDRSMELLAPLAWRKGLLLFRSVHADLPSEFIGDAGRIRQVLTNLVGNALKFTEQGHIHVTLETADLNGRTGLQFSIADSGPGLGLAQQALLFQEYVQGEAGEVSTIAGSGLGLVICKRVVEAMGGRIHMESAEGSGCIVRFQIPLAATSSLASRPLRDLRIGVADRSSEGHQELCWRLQRLGAEVSSLTAGERAGASGSGMRRMDLLVLGDTEESAQLPVVRQLLDAETLGLILHSGSCADVTQTRLPSLSRMARAQVLANTILRLRRSEARIADASLGGRTVLVADRSVQLRQSLSSQLRALGAIAIEASSGAEVLAVYATNPLDLILLEAELPLLDADQIQGLRLPMVLLLAPSSGATRRNWTWTLQKPISPSALIRTCHDALRASATDKGKTRADHAT